MKVFYNENQSVKSNKSISPSAGKPALLMAELEKLSYIQIESDWPPLSLKDFCLVHERKHVQEILNCKKANGFGNYSKDVSDSLYWTSASFYHAARYAYVNKTVAMSPTSGFHHAGYRSSGGFCTFNGLMISAALLIKEFPDIKIGIIDLDAHFGNGTVEIIERLGLDIRHYTITDYIHELKKKSQFEKMQEFSDRDMIFFQAGADAHIDDPIGGGLTTEELMVRDRTVFEYAKTKNIPLVWNLAGGYQTPVSRVIVLHMNTVKICNEVFENTRNNVLNKKN